MVRVLTFFLCNQGTNAYKNLLDMVHYLTVIICYQVTIAFVLDMVQILTVYRCNQMPIAYKICYICPMS